MSMKKIKNMITAVIFTTALALSACGQQTEPENTEQPVAAEQVKDAEAKPTDAAKTDAVQQQAPMTFTDHLNREVTVDNPQRVAALLGSFAQVWQLAGGQVIATADDAWDDLQLDLPEDTVNLGGTKNLNLELLLESEPDLILASTNTRQNLEWKETLESTGIPVAYFNIEDFDDYLELLSICTDITGRKDLFEQYGTAVQEQIDEVLKNKRTDSPTVLCMVASASAIFAKQSEGNVLGAMLKTMGCENIADSDTLLLEKLSLEHILVEDPDYIFFVQRGDDEEGMKAYVNEFLMEHPIWNKLTAVQNDRVYFMEKNLFNLKPNHRWGEAYEILADILNES